MRHAPGSSQLLEPPPPRGPWLGRGYVVRWSHRLLRPHLPVSIPPLDFPGCGYTKGLAIRDRFGWNRDLPPFTAVLFRHAILIDPGESDGCIYPVLPRRQLPSPGRQGLGTPFPTVRFELPLPRTLVGQLFESQSIRFRYGLVDRSPPGRTDLGLLPAAETFTPELAPDESPPSNVRYGFGADWAICAGGTLTRMNDGFLGRTPPQLTDRPSLHATSFTPEWFRAAPESRARTAAFAQSAGLGPLGPSRVVLSTRQSSPKLRPAASLLLASAPDSHQTLEVDFRAPLVACPGGTYTRRSFGPSLGTPLFEPPGPTRDSLRQPGFESLIPS